MRRMFVIAAVAALCALAGTRQASAAAYGFYFEGGAGLGQIDFESRASTDTDYESRGLGILMDTNPAGKDAMGWRFMAGLDSFDMDLDSGGSLDMEGLSLSGAMTFPIKKDGNIRLWLGPEARLGYFSGDFLRTEGRDVDLYTAGIGGLFGANIFPNPDGKFCVSLTAGLRFNGYYAQHDVNDDTDEGLGWNGVGSLNFSLLWGGSD